MVRYYLLASRLTVTTYLPGICFAAPRRHRPCGGESNQRDWLAAS